MRNVKAVRRKRNEAAGLKHLYRYFRQIFTGRGCGQFVDHSLADSLHENNPNKEFDELRFAVDDDGTNILIIINKGEITGAVDIDNIPVC